MVAAAIGRVEMVPAHVDIVELFDGAGGGPLFLIEGYACLYKIGSHGGRQILAFHLPGEMMNPGATILPDTHWGIATLSPCQIARFNPAVVAEMVAKHPAIVDALWADALINTEIALEWVMNLGRREAPARVAHLFCELATRMAAIGRCIDLSFTFPVSQVDLADATGITHVHLNRVLRRLRAEGMLSLHGHHITIHHWDRLRELADFNPAYLHVRADGAAEPAKPSAADAAPGPTGRERGKPAD